ncbi:MAG TPA: hypothetical protein VNZ52_14670 [Candidatus Thermoplasmatota archaeon]|nr:hypothetical protein [Candidatus Thermoplasmatota archaeon]
MIPRRTLALALVLVAPLLAAGCVNTGDDVADGGNCEEVAYGWLRWLQPVNMTYAERALQATDKETEWYTAPDGSQWLLFRHNEAAGDEKNETARRFVGVIRPFSLVDQNETATNTSENVTMLSVHFVKRPGDPPFGFPIEAQQAQMRDYMDSLAVLFQADLGPPDTQFVDVRTACGGDTMHDWGVDLTPDHETGQAPGGAAPRPDEEGQRTEG